MRREIHTNAIILSLLVLAIATLWLMPPMHQRGVFLAYEIGFASGLVMSRIFPEFRWLRKNQA